MKLLPCLTTVILATCTALSTVAQDRSLEEFVDSIAEEHVGNTLAGLSIGVTRGSEVLLKKSYGLANIEYQVPWQWMQCMRWVQLLNSSPLSP